jgi:hypothetical protein
MKMEIKCKWILSANKLTILNAWKRGGVISSQKKFSHPNHETSPLFNMKMPKAKLIAKLIMDTCFINNCR